LRTSLTAEPSRLLVVAGMPRTGTTSLFHILGEHPGVFAPFRKEMGYFLYNWPRGESWYRRAYRGMAAGQVGLDVTPEYFFSAEALDRMACFDADVRVLLGVREPGSFARSLYREYGQRYRMPPFEEFLSGYRYARGPSSVEVRLGGGALHRMIEAYRARFQDRLLLYDFSTIAREPLAIVQAIEPFLGLRPHFTDATFRNWHLNRGDRRNSRLLSYLASREPMIEGLGRLLPASWLRAAAKGFYGQPPASSAVAVAPPPPTVPAGLDETFRADREYVDGLFRESPVVDGLGRSWRAALPRAQ
jgi:hypothetical protein